jgi:hypothetical protein
MGCNVVFQHRYTLCTDKIRVIGISITSTILKQIPHILSYMYKLKTLTSETQSRTVITRTQKGRRVFHSPSLFSLCSRLVNGRLNMFAKLGNTI